MKLMSKKDSMEKCGVKNTSTWHRLSRQIGFPPPICLVDNGPTFYEEKALDDFIKARAAYTILHPPTLRGHQKNPPETRE